MGTFKVWVHVEEEVDEETGETFEIDLEFGHSRMFEREADAVAFAEWLDRMARGTVGDNFADLFSQIRT